MGDAIVLLFGFILFWHFMGVLFAPAPPKKEEPCQCGKRKGVKVGDYAFFLEVCNMQEAGKAA